MTEVSLTLDSRPDVQDAYAKARVAEILDGPRRNGRWKGLLRTALITGGIGIGLLAFGPGALAGLAAIHGIAGTSAGIAINSLATSGLIGTVGEAVTAGGLATATIAAGGTAVSGVRK